MIGRVALRINDIVGMQLFYEQAVGLRALERHDNVLTLGTDTPLVQLTADADARPAPEPSTGLFHMAILVPDRAELARAVKRVTESGERFTGASDHYVSEALYLRDPEGNGIEIYRDRPRDEWEHLANGDVRMGTERLDVDAVMRELPEDEPVEYEMPAGTRMGHVHLHVADLASTEDFYTRELGLDVTVRSYPGAIFMSRDGYHHHVGANTWAGEGAPAPPPGSLGLDWYEMTLPGVEERIVADPSGNRVKLLRG